MCPDLSVELSSYLGTQNLPSRDLLTSIKPFVAPTFCCGAVSKPQSVQLFPSINIA
jgi:hypothetical protein